MRSNKTRYFLVELILNCLFFTLSAAVCVNLFVAGATTNKESGEISMAALKAQSAAEAFKASNGDLDRYSEIMGSISEGDFQVCYYDEEWMKTAVDDYDFAVYLTMTTSENGLVVATISVTDHKDSIYELEVLKYLGVGGGSGG